MHTDDFTEPICVYLCLSVVVSLFRRIWYQYTIQDSAGRADLAPPPQAGPIQSLYLW